MFSKKRVYPDELEDYFYSVFDKEFACDVEDGSIEEVSRLLTDVYNKTSSGDYTLLNRTLASEVKNGIQSSIFREESNTSKNEDVLDDEGDEEDDGMDVEDTNNNTSNNNTSSENSSQQQPTDPDGWTVVTRRSKKKNSISTTKVYGQYCGTDQSLQMTFTLKSWSLQHVTLFET